MEKKQMPVSLELAAIDMAALDGGAAAMKEEGPGLRNLTRGINAQLSAS